ncbi:MAG: hypothetical protein ACOYKD_00765 [Anaerolineaceae bacterium]|jgi:hypothetical protein
MLQTVVKFFADLEVPIYLILGLVAVVYLRRLFLALEERRTAIYGLERAAAQRKVRASVSMLVLVGVLTAAEFVVATFLAEQVKNIPSYSTPSPTVGLTPTSTLDPAFIPEDATPTPTRYPQANIKGVQSDCIAGVIEISSPKMGDTLQGVVEIIGSANTPSFGSYKYDYSTMGEPNWQTISAGGEARLDESLGFWYTADLVPGEYMLRLVALDNDGKEQSACVLVVNVIPEE